jgi:superfamily II DNA/RNA helicase
MEVENTGKNNFKDYNLKLELLRGLYSLGFEEPTNLQKKVLSPLFSSSKDILVQSPKLTGKKISFIIYSLQNISKEKKEMTQCLILCHTRESITKIKNIYKEIAKFMNIKIHSLLGGTIKDDIKELSGGAEIVVGTPGRVIDLVNKKILNLNELDFFVIDDIKQMIEKGFIETIFNILNSANNKCRKAIFVENEEYYKIEENNSNTQFDLNLSDDIKNKLKIGKDIVIIDNKIDDKNKLINYRIFKITLKEEMKYNILLNIFKILDISQTIIFCNDEKTVSDLNKNLSDLNYICNLLNEDRTKNISNFKKGQIRIMITTFDINLEEINLYNNAMIINYQMPGDINSYMKYFGRNEFFGKEGIIINFVTYSDKDTITSLEKVVENSIQELPNEFSDNI